MATSTLSLRLCLQASRDGSRAAVLAAAAVSPTNTRLVAGTHGLSKRATAAVRASGRRSLSTAPSRWRSAASMTAVKPTTRRPAAEDEEENKYPFQDAFDESEALANRVQTWDDAIAEVVTDEIRAKDPNIERKLQELTAELQEVAGKDFDELDAAFNMSRFYKPSMRNRLESAFNDEEEDEDYLTDERKDDSFAGDDITSMAHGKLDEIREQRHYARVTVWEMPLLAKYAKKFEPPKGDEVLRFRYTSYLGEFHPAEKKVAVQFCPTDLELTEAQQLKLKKLAGPRYNPQTEMIKMSCEMFEHQAQNKRYLGDLIAKLITEAKDPTDTFEDVPLDLRHHPFKLKPKFPREWRMSEERRQAIQASRSQAFLLDQQKTAEGELVDGAERIASTFAAAAPTPAMAERMAQLVHAGGRVGASSRGRQKW